jgi:hypothetical protein
LATVSLALALAFCSGGCGTTPTTTHASTASYDGNEQNSGVVRVMPNGSLEVTEGARTRYNALIRIYGDRLLPAIQEDFGLDRLSGAHYSLTCEGAEAWFKMIELQKREEIDRKP